MPFKEATRNPSRRRSAWVSAASAVATAGLLAMAIGTPVAVAASRSTQTVTRVVTADPATATPADSTPAPLDTSSASPTASASPAPSATDVPPQSPTPSAAPSMSASASASPSSSGGSAPTLAPATQVLKGSVGVAISSSEPLSPAHLSLPVEYSIAPSLPQGLGIDVATGVVSGTPTTAQSTRSYTITATETAGTRPLSADALVTISISPRVSPASQVLELSTGFDMSPSATLKASGFPDPVTFTIAPALPDSLTIDASTGIITGNPATALTRSVYVITADDGTFSDTATVDITIVCGNPATNAPDCAIPLAMAGALVATPQLLAAPIEDPIHGPYASMQTDTCARCHRMHSAQTSNSLLADVKTPDTLCLSCHDGTGAPGPNVQAQYASAMTGGKPVAGFSHNVDAVIPNSHTDLISDEEGATARIDEFKDASNRHALCVDCHNPHSASGSPTSTMESDGWTPGGSITGATGVAVTNGTPASNVTYSFMDALTPATRMTKEYQLCFKCHSGYTKLPAGQTDTAVEFNPAAGSYHPIEAAGANTSPAMQGSLAGASPYKLWSFTVGQTVRCAHCHASGTTPLLDSNGQPVLDANNRQIPVPTDPHAAPATSPKRTGLLLADYEQNPLARPSFSSGAPYQLCFSCHSTVPFQQEAATKPVSTNFRFHNKHVLGEKVPCAECHYRSHSTAVKVTPEQPFADATVSLSNAGLVAFAPDVEPYGSSGILEFTKTGVSSGSCTLNCHGEQHDGWDYTPN